MVKSIFFSTKITLKEVIKEGIEMTIGERLTLLRGTESPKIVAESIGITVTALWNYENDYRVPKDEIKKKISIYYNKTVDEIFFAE